MRHWLNQISLNFDIPQRHIQNSRPNFIFLVKCFKMTSNDSNWDKLCFKCHFEAFKRNYALRNSCFKLDCTAFLFKILFLSFCHFRGHFAFQTYQYQIVDDRYFSCDQKDQFHRFPSGKCVKISFQCILRNKVLFWRPLERGFRKFAIPHSGILFTTFFFSLGRLGAIF